MRSTRVTHFVTQTIKGGRPAGRNSLVRMVELRGFEPLTSSMPWKRATNCAKAPGGPVPDARSPDPNPEILARTR